MTKSSIMSSLSLSHTLSPWMGKWWRERCMYAANKQRGGGHLRMHAPSTPGFMSKEVHASCTPGCMPTKEGACTLKTLSLAHSLHRLQGERKLQPQAHVKGGACGR